MKAHPYPKVIKNKCSHVFFREDTDELAAFRSQWKEELGLISTEEAAAGSGGSSADHEREGPEGDSNYSTPAVDGQLEALDDGVEDAKVEVCV